MHVGPSQPIRTNSHNILDVSSSSSSSDTLSRLYEETPKALDELKHVEEDLTARSVKAEKKKSVVSRLAKAFFGGREPESGPLETKKEALLTLLTNSLSVNREATAILFSPDPEQKHLQLVDFSGSQHDMTILARLGEGTAALAVKVDDLVGGTEREAVLLVGKTPIAQESDFVEDPLRMKGKTLEEQQESKQLYERLRGRGLHWTPIIHSVMVIKHPIVGFSKAELQEPLKPLSSLKKGPERFAERLIEAMEKTHRKGITHGDVKPDNIMLRHDFKKRAQPVLIDWDSKLMFEKSSFEGLSRDQIVSLMEERRFGTTDFIPKDYTERLDALIARAKECSNYELERVKGDFFTLQKEKDCFGLACTLYQLVEGEEIPRTEEGTVDRVAALEKAERWKVPSRIGYIVRNAL